MRSCSRDGDCRGGYSCVDIAAENAWGAVVVDQGRSTRVCALPPPPPATGKSEVCAALPPGVEPPEASPIEPVDAGDAGPADAAADANRADANRADANRADAN
jgi:hypothetical protein